MRHKGIALFNYWTNIPVTKLDQLSQRVKNDDVDFFFAVKSVVEKGKVIYLVIDIVDYNKKTGFNCTLNSYGAFYISDHEFQSIAEEKLFFEEYVNVLIDFLDLQDDFRAPISVMEVESIPPNSNPYHHDLTRQGIHIDDWELMFTDGFENVRLVNIPTGRVFDLDLYFAQKAKGNRNV